MERIMAILVVVDLVLAALKTFGFVGPISWLSIYWGFIGLSLLSYGVDET